METYGLSVAAIRRCQNQIAKHAMNGNEVTEDVRSRIIQIEREDMLRDSQHRVYSKLLDDANMAVARAKIRAGDFSSMPELSELQSMLKNKGGNSGALYPYYYTTFNFKSDVTLERATKAILKYVNRKTIAWSEWVYEQRGTTELEMGKGIHVHMINCQRGDIFNSRWVESTRNAFKDLIELTLPATLLEKPKGTLSKDPKLYIEPIKEEWIDDKRDYMRGNKTEEGKDAKVAIDRIWRPLMGLQEYYMKENLRSVYTNDLPSEAPSRCSTPPSSYSTDQEDCLEDGETSSTFDS